MGQSVSPKSESLSAYLRRMNASPGAEGKAMWPQLVSSVRRLEAVEEAAREVVEAWDGMPNTLPDFPGVLEWSQATLRLREALDG